MVFMVLKMVINRKTKNGVEMSINFKLILN